EDSYDVVAGFKKDRAQLADGGLTVGTASVQSAFLGDKTHSFGRGRDRPRLTPLTTFLLLLIKKIQTRSSPRRCGRLRWKCAPEGIDRKWPRTIRKSCRRCGRSSPTGSDGSASSSGSMEPECSWAIMP